jgi:hypothetical protein
VLNLVFWMVDSGSGKLYPVVNVELQSLLLIRCSGNADAPVQHLAPSKPTTKAEA